VGRRGGGLISTCRHGLRGKREGVGTKEFIIKMEGNTGEFSDISGSEIH
jgi:hypothetical protein